MQALFGYFNRDTFFSRDSEEVKGKVEFDEGVQGMSIVVG